MTEPTLLDRLIDEAAKRGRAEEQRDGLSASMARVQNTLTEMSSGADALVKINTKQEDTIAELQMEAHRLGNKVQAGIIRMSELIVVVEGLLAKLPTHKKTQDLRRHSISAVEHAREHANGLIPF